MPDPVNTVPPAVSGTPTVGLTLSCDTGTWTNSPTSYAYQWQLETAVGSGVYANISAATANTYRLIEADLGLRLRCVVTASNTPPASPWLGWTVPAVPGGATLVTTKAQLTNILQGGGVAGTTYDATGLTASYTDTLYINGRYGSETTVFLGASVTFDGSLLSTTPAVDVKGAQHLTIYGGHVTNPVQGGGIVVRGDNSAGNAPVTFLKWWDFLINNVGSQGLQVHQNTGSVTADLRGEISRWGQNLALDPHTTKGSGQHACYVGATSAISSRVTGCTFVLHIHDGQYGGGCQIAPGVLNSEFQVQAERLTYLPPVGADGTGGNIFQLFGAADSGLTISFLEGDTVRKGLNLAGDFSPGTPLAVTHAAVTNAVVGSSPNVKYDDYPGSSRVNYTNTT